LVLLFEDPANCFPQLLNNFTFSPAMHKVYVSLHHAPALVIYHWLIATVLVGVIAHSGFDLGFPND
jgi:hypothetical protein